MEEHVFQIETDDADPTSETDALKMEVKKLKDENQRQAEELRKQKEQAEIDYEGMSTTILRLVQEIDLLEGHIQRLKQANKEQVIKDLVQDHVQEMKQENKELITNLTELREEIFVIEAENEEKGSQLELLTAHVQTLTQENEELAANYKANVAKRIERDTKETQTDADDLYDSEDDDPMYSNPARHHTRYTPYSTHIKDRWFTTRIERSPDAEPFGCSNIADIAMYNVSSSFFSETNVQDKIAEMYGRYGKKVFYHATDAGSVTNILENGIDLKKAKRSLDFSSGRGFYVTESYQRSVYWSGKVAGWMRSTKAIIAFTIDESLLQETPHISLRYDTDTNRKWWECIVSHFRRGKTSPDVKTVLKDVKFITGPVANVRWVGPTTRPVPFPGFTQMCIRKEDYAKRFGSLQNIALVIFFY